MNKKKKEEKERQEVKQHNVERQRGDVEHKM